MYTNLPNCNDVCTCTGTCMPSTYLYDSTSGFYYDTTTGLYYDASTQVNYYTCTVYNTLLHVHVLYTIH